MAILIQESWLPATFTPPPMSDDEFMAFCGEYPDLFFEMSTVGELRVMPPAGALTGVRNVKIGAALYQWNEWAERGVCTGCTAGFVLPNGARRSADAAWTSNERLDAMPPGMINGCWHLCPNFVIELRSDTDRLKTVREKMEEWIDNGAELGWLIDPSRKAVEIYRPTREPEILTDIGTVTGEGPVDGFELDLKRVWHPRGF